MEGNGPRNDITNKSGMLVSQILMRASIGMPTLDFLREVSKLLLDFTRCDEIEIRIVERNKLLYCITANEQKLPLQCGTIRGRHNEAGQVLPCLKKETDLEKICQEILNNRFDPELPYFTPNGSFCIGDTSNPLDLSSETCKWAGGRTFHIDSAFKSLAVIPFKIENTDFGLLLLKSRKKNFLAAHEVECYEDFAKILGIASTQRRAQIALRERVKELTCLYGIAKVAARPGISLEQILTEAVALLPQGWLYPDIASASIDFAGQTYSTEGFHESPQMQTTQIMIGGEKRGAVQVAYSKKMPELDEGPFLKEERHLIDAIGRELSLIIETMQKEEEKTVLQEQLRHADRLATIGQLAAGVVHELNEPLASILGRAQLAAKIPELPEQARLDNEKIVKASLHAREIINKLKLFARQEPSRKDRINLNDIVYDGLYFVESRCAKAGITLLRDLDPDLPDITADAGQLYQVLINLVVNAVQATPDGGRITVRTAKHGADVALIVQDTGAGMDEKMLKHIFTPFFTTKDVDEGTGLGLAVVHGIVDSHGGSISVESTLGKGSCFEVHLPSTHPEKQKEEEGNESAKE